MRLFFLQYTLRGVLIGKTQPNQTQLRQTGDEYISCNVRSYLK